MTRIVLMLALAAALLAACGDDQPTAGTGGSAGDGGAQTELTITVDAGDGSDAVQYTLTCDPPGGTHPNPEAACELLQSASTLDPNPLEPVGPDVACTEIYGGPQTATVVGTVDGAPVRYDFSRTNGCEIARWDAAQPLLVVPGGV